MCNRSLRVAAATNDNITNGSCAAGKDGLAFSLDAKPAGGAHGDLGWASGNYVVKDKTGRVVDTGKYLSVSKKKDGKWVYIRDTWNSDGPPTGKQ